jgi:hypothetical protein
MDFYKAQGTMKSLLTGDIASESLEIAEDEYILTSNCCASLEERDFSECAFVSKTSRDVPPGEDIKWMCGDCGATDWTPVSRRCKYCRD